MTSRLAATLAENDPAVWNRMRSYYDGCNVLITGGLGFIGSNLAIVLAELRAKVTLVDSMIPDYGGNRFNIEPIAGSVEINIADVRDRSPAGTEEDQVAGTDALVRHRLQAPVGPLQIGVARQDHAVHPVAQLDQPRAVEPERRRAAP